MSALTGLVACGVIVAEGPPGTPEAFTDAERDAVDLAVILGQQRLARMSQVYSPNGFLQCSFVNEYHSASSTPGYLAADRYEGEPRASRLRDLHQGGPVA